ncbi:MAG: NIPSNAP family protein [Thermomicrobiales bacterium]
MDGTHTPDMEPAIVELRQYRTVPGRRDDLIALFEREFVREQQRLGIVLLGWFREPGDPDRFTWLRGFSDYEARGNATRDFYDGAVWQRFRNEANASLDDSDDVFMLQAAWPNSGMSIPKRPIARATDATSSYADLVIAHIAPQHAPEVIEDLRSWSEGGIPGAGFYVTLQRANNYPRLPIHEDVFVIVGIVPSHRTDGRALASEMGERLQRWLTQPLEARRLQIAGPA